MVAVMSKKPIFFELHDITRSIDRYPLLTIEEERIITTRYQKTRRHADLDRLVNCNLRFVLKVAMTFKWSRLPLADLMQEGVIGLMKACEKFDPARGYRLVTYASWWIRLYIQKYVINNWSLARVGKTQGERKLFISLLRARHAIEHRKFNGEEATPEEIAAFLNVKVEEVRKMILVMSSARELSLNAPIQEGQDDDYTRFLVDPRDSQEATLLTLTNDRNVNSLVARNLRKLPKQECEVLRLRYMNEPQLTLQEIGDVYGFSRERARQIVASGLKRLRMLIEADGGTDDLDF